MDGEMSSTVYSRGRNILFQGVEQCIPWGGTMYSMGWNMKQERSEVLRDLGVVEVVHLVHHANGRIDDGEGAKGSRALAKAQT